MVARVRLERGEVLKSGWIKIYSGGRAARLADGVDVGGEKKKRFKHLGLELLARR